MNITDQIIRGASDYCQSWMNLRTMQTDGITGKALVSIYKEWEEEISKEIYESEFSTGLIFRDILLYNYYEFISNYLFHYFRPVDTLAEIEFREDISDDYNYESERRPIVKKSYNFSINHNFGVKITKHLTNLFILQRIKGKLGLDVGLYPGKCDVTAFIFENVVYVWENGHDRKKRLTIDQTGNKEILKVFLDIFMYQKKKNEELYAMIDDLPFIEGKEAQKSIDIIWYRRSKQTPLTYRCFPNTNTIDFSFPPVDTICRHKGLYCIKPEIIEIRYGRFLDLMNSLEPHEKEDLLEETIDYFKRFLKTDYFENEKHKKFYKSVLDKLKYALEELQNADKPKLTELEKSLVEGMKRGMKNYFKLQEVAVDGMVKGVNELYASSNPPEDNNLDINTKPNASIDNENDINPNINKFNAEYFMGFMNGNNKLKGGVIMNEADYKRLLKYTQQLMDECSVPETIIPIPKINLNNQEIIHTYRRIHDYIYPHGKKRKAFFIFFDKVFAQLNQPEKEIDKNNNYINSNCYKKFRFQPDHYNKLL